MPRKINFLVFMSMQWYILGTALPILMASQKKGGKINVIFLYFREDLCIWFCIQEDLICLGGKMRPKQKKCNTFWRDLFDIRWFYNKLTTDLFSIHYVTEIMLLWWCSFSILMLYPFSKFIHAFIFKLVY